MFLCCFALVGHFELLELQSCAFLHVADGRCRECWVKEIHFVVSAFACMLLRGWMKQWHSLTETETEKKCCVNSLLRVDNVFVHWEVILKFMDNSTRKPVLWMEYGNVKVCDVLLRRCDSFMSCSVHVFEVSSKTSMNNLRGIHWHSLKPYANSVCCACTNAKWNESVSYTHLRAHET